MGTLALAAFFLVGAHFGMALNERPYNAAVILGSHIKFVCDPGYNQVSRWNVYPMSKRPDDLSAWRWNTVSLGGKLVGSSTKYTLRFNIYDRMKTLEIHNLTREDAAVVECQSINYFQKQAQLVILEPPVCFANVSGRQYYAGEFVSFTCTQYFHKDVWAPRMQWSWVSPNISLTAVNYTDETKAEYTVVLEIRPEYNGRQLRCDIIYDKLTPGTYPRTWDFATNVPQYRHNYTTRLDILLEPQIEIENHKPKYYFGDVVTCTARGNPSSHNVEWLDDNGMPAKYTLSTGLAHSMSAILTISPGMEGNHSYTCNAFYDINGEDTVLSETIHFVVVDMYRGPLNMAALRSTNVEFACSRPDNGLIVWNLYRMSQRPDNPAEWPQHTLAFGGEFLKSSSKYGLSLSYGVETLQIRDLTSDDAAVVECEGVNSYWKRAQLVVLYKPTCTHNASGSWGQYVEGQVVSFTCKQRFYQDIWAPRMELSLTSPDVKLNAVNQTDDKMAVYTAVVKMIPEYNGSQLRCDVLFDRMPAGVYPYHWDFAVNTPAFRHSFTQEGHFNVLK